MGGKMRHTQAKCTSVSESGCPGGRLYPFQAAETGQLLPETWTRSTERSSPWCVLENLIPPKAALVIFFWISQTLPYRKPARTNTETSTTLISLGQSSMAVETRQRDQWYTAHTEAKQRCWTQKRKKQTFCVHLPKNIKISKNFWVSRFYGFFFPF